MLSHIWNKNIKRRFFGVKVYGLDHESGTYVFTTKHFNVTAKYLATKIDAGCHAFVDFEQSKVRIKRSAQKGVSSEAADGEWGLSQPKEEKEADGSDKDVDLDVDIEDIIGIIPSFIKALQTTGRAYDFIPILHAIADHKLDNNIACHLLIDIGNFLRPETVYSARYSEVTK